MDELDALRGMRTALAKQESPERLRMRAGRWAEPARRTRRARPGFRVPLVSAVTATAVAAGALAAVALTGDGGAPTPHAPVAGGPAVGGPVAPGDALLVAATSAENAPAGTYWHTKRISGEINGVGTKTDHYMVDSRQVLESWTTRAGASSQRRLGPVGYPWQPADAAKWRAAGSPNRVYIPNPDADGSKTFIFMGDNERLQPMPPDDDVRFFGLTVAQISDLPTDPGKLKDALLDLKGHWRAASPDGPERPMRELAGAERARALSEVAGTLLSDAPTPPKIRAAAFRMLAGLPGVRAEGTAKDPTGRPGNVISLPVASTVPLGLYTAPKRLGTYRRQWIIDPKRGLLLAVRDLVVTPPHGSLPLPSGDRGQHRVLRVSDVPDRFHKPGEIVDYEVYEVAEWTDRGPAN
ncbi:CU044_5270 family protein [Actinomadura atramentaria]|uniref:CU044_5270 family protein n=1 Tax=Actinomadura atramentaria TaxID=1990 RepID=UPI0003788833|nr:CU044_5270 family protein [Actinomadura atramentaria]